MLGSELHSSQDPLVGAPSRKRRKISTPSPSAKRKAPVVDLTKDNDDQELASPKVSKKGSPRKAKEEEKRLNVFRKHAPKTYLEKLSRALSQRMFVLDRIRAGTDEVPKETIEMAGTTGNIYSVTINQQPSCTCPDHQKGNQCKHIVYVLHNVLKAPEHLQYQLAFLSSELREIFSQAPLPASSQTSASEADPEHPSNRKAIDGDCPICFTEFDAETEDIVWCKAACGNNIHKGCFEQWAKSQRGKEVSCVYCRTPWQGDEELMKRVKSKGKVNEEGYVNVADELGLSGLRAHIINRGFAGGSAIPNGKTYDLSYLR